MAMNTWAAISEAKVNTVGLCHGVQGGAKLISKAKVGIVFHTKYEGTSIKNLRASFTIKDARS